MAKKKPSRKQVTQEGLINFLDINAKRMTLNPTKWESLLKKYLSDLHYKFQFQVPIIYKRKGYIVDFLLTDYKIFIEVDGKKFHSSKEQIRKDNLRTRRLQTLGYQPLRFTNSQISTFKKEQIQDIIEMKISMTNLKNQENGR